MSQNVGDRNLIQAVICSTVVCSEQYSRTQFCSSQSDTKVVPSCSVLILTDVVGGRI